MTLSFTPGAMLLITLALALPAHGKTVWRCGEGGKVYSDAPCAGGRAVDVADPRSADDVQAARNDIKRQEALATRMRKERLAEERRHLSANAMASNLGPSKTPALQTGKLKPKAKHKPASNQRRGFSESEAEGTWRAAGVPSRRKKD